MRLLRLTAALAFLSSLSALPAAAQTVDTKPFADACEAQALAFVGEDRADAAPTLCACVTGEFEGASQSDFDMLTKDMLGTVTDEERQAYETFEDLTAASRAAIDTCVKSAGLGDLMPFSADDPGVIEGDVPFVTPDMTAFAVTCRASDSLLNWMSSGKQTPEEAREAVCSCLVEEFPLNFQQSTVDILAKTFDGTLTDAERAAYTNYETFAKRAEDIMGSCVARAGL